MEAYNHIKDIILQLKRVWDDKFVHDVDNEDDIFQRNSQDTIFLETSHFERLSSFSYASSFSDLFKKTLPELHWNDYLSLYLACIQVLQGRIHPLTSIRLQSTSNQKKSEKITIGDWILFQRDAILNDELSPERFISLLDSIFTSNPIFKDIQLLPHQLSCLHDYVHKLFLRPFDKRQRSSNDSSQSVGQLKSDLIRAIRQGEFPKFISTYRFHSFFSTVESMKLHEKALTSIIAEALELSHLFRATKQVHSAGEDRRRASALVRSQFKALSYMFHPYALSAEVSDTEASASWILGPTLDGTPVKGVSEPSPGDPVEAPAGSSVVVSESDSSAEGAKQTDAEEFIIPKKPRRSKYFIISFFLYIISS